MTDNDDYPDTDAFKALIAGIEGLNPENQSLLLLSITSKVADLLDHLRDHSDGLDAHGQGLLAAVGQASAFAALVASHTHGQHEDWTATGDKRVDAVFDAYLKVIKSMVLGPGDIPDDVLERMAKGKGTPEDHAAIRSIIAERTGHEVDDLEIDVVGKTPKAKDDPEPEASTGLYL